MTKLWQKQFKSYWQTRYGTLLTGSINNRQLIHRNSFVKSYIQKLNQAVKCW